MHVAIAAVTAAAVIGMITAAPITVDESHAAALVPRGNPFEHIAAAAQAATNRMNEATRNADLHYAFPGADAETSPVQPKLNTDSLFSEPAKGVEASAAISPHSGSSKSTQPGESLTSLIDRLVPVRKPRSPRKSPPLIQGESTSSIRTSQRLLRKKVPKPTAEQLAFTRAHVNLQKAKAALDDIQMLAQVHRVSPRVLAKHKKDLEVARHAFYSIPEPQRITSAPTVVPSSESLGKALVPHQPSPAAANSVTVPTKHTGTAQTSKTHEPEAIDEQPIMPHTRPKLPGTTEQEKDTLPASPRPLSIVFPDQTRGKEIVQAHDGQITGQQDGTLNIASTSGIKKRKRTSEKIDPQSVLEFKEARLAYEKAKAALAAHDAHSWVFLPGASERVKREKSEPLEWMLGEMAEQNALKKQVYSAHKAMVLADSARPEDVEYLASVKADNANSYQRLRAAQLRQERGA